jgi:hypothetical protein
MPLSIVLHIPKPSSRILVYRSHPLTRSFTTRCITQPPCTKRWSDDKNRTRSIKRWHSTTPTPQPVININAPSPIPVATRGLYSALLDLERDALNHVPLSRIKLALRSIQTPMEDAVIRIAILSLGSIKDAKRLATCLLTDVLASKGEWESLLEEDGDSRSIILRYGNEGEKVTYNSAFREIFVPSELLKTHKIELVLSTLNADRTEATLDRLLVPRLDAQIAETESFTSVTYPVHKSILLGSGFNDLLAMGRLVPPSSSQSENVMFAIQESTPSEAQSEEDFAFVDLQKAEQAIKELRSSVSNAHDYQVHWSKSHMSSLTDWLIRGTDSAQGILKKPIETFITQILVDTLTKISSSLQRLSIGTTKDVVANDSALEIATDLQKLSERAHAEIQQEIDVWAQSRVWDRLKWWKLLWRVDDVEMVTTDLTHKILRQAERELIFISGRVRQAGLMVNLTPDIWTTIPEPLSSTPEVTTIESQTELKFIEPSQSTQESYSPPAPTVQPPPFLPYPQHIRIMREIHANVSIPELQRYAQNSMLAFISTTSLSGALSALLYVSSPAIGIYGAGSIAALGTMFALQRFQSKWEGRREEFLQGVSQSGISAVTDGVKTLFNVMELGLSESSEGTNEEVEAIEKADRAVKQAEEALHRTGT